MDKSYELTQKNQSLEGKIRNLEEQHDLMHNFLVEINKYLVKLTEKDMGDKNMCKMGSKKKMHESKKEDKKEGMEKKDGMKKKGK